MRIGQKVPSPTPSASAARPSSPSDKALAGQIYERMAHVNLNNHLLKQAPNTRDMRQVAVGSNQQAFLDKKGNFYVKVTYDPALGMKEPGYWAGPIPLKPGSTTPPPSNRPPVSEAALRSQIQQKMGQVNLSSYLTRPPDTMNLRHLMVEDRINSGGPKQEAYVDPARNQFYMRVTYNPSLGMKEPGYWAGPIPLK